MPLTAAHTASAREVDEDASATDDVASTSGRSHTAGHQRATLCVSSQVGCIMGCTFCATGTMGLKGDLSAGEILEQLVHAQRVTPIRNVVFMVRFPWYMLLCHPCKKDAHDSAHPMPQQQSAHVQVYVPYQSSQCKHGVLTCTQACQLILAERCKTCCRLHLSLSVRKFCMHMPSCGACRAWENL